ncbi:F-box protein At4g09920-like [Lotus japonicus]|uniref:F-box protein At4g09920-like n=1 Tax=Lotus japonicus TaxID=34305 RepID=UPI002590F163|nr:F-box protein At4g09920-like [Lotus japonicus]
MAPMADRISELPDEILLHILSFLPIEDIIATSLVSKKWRPLWLSVPTLDFDQDRYFERYPEKQQTYHINSFIDFVCAALQERGSRQPIKGFRLLTYDESQSRHDYHYVNRWLNKAIQRGVENLEVDCYPGYELPSNFFNCTTLVVVKLHWAGSSLCNDFSSVYLPSLKTLHLNPDGGIAYFCKAQDFMEFLYGCPILENLVAKTLRFNDCSYEGKVKSLSKLVRAEICDLDGEGVFHYSVKVFSNVKFLSIDQCNEDIPMFPNLIHLELIRVELKSVLDILSCSPNLQIFDLDFKYSSGEDWPNPQLVPECFSSQLKKCVIANYTGMANQMRFVKYVMQNSTSLRSMTISCSSDDHQKKLQMLIELASCPRSSTTCQLLFK